MITLVILASLAPQTTWYVDAAAAAPGDGTLASPYTSIGYAMDQPGTVSGDTVSVAPGTYLDELIDFAGKEVHLLSQGGATQTAVIPPASTSGVDNSTVRMTSGEGPDAIVEGFKFVGGIGTPIFFGPSGPTSGGALLVDGSSPTIASCEFVDNRADLGGAICLLNSNTTVRGCTIRDIDNPFGAVAAIYIDGGNVEVSDSLIQDCSSDAYFGFGGAVAARNCGLSIRGTEIHNCEVSEENGAAISIQAANAFLFDVSISGCRCTESGYGGAIHVSSSTLTIDTANITGNSTFEGSGGALSAGGSTLFVVDSHFSANHIAADYDGGALSLTGCSATIRRTTFASNEARSGGAISAVSSSLHVTDCTFEQNRANGLNSIGGFGGAIRGGDIIERCHFIGNRGSAELGQFTGAAVSGAMLVRQCTLIDNLPDAGSPGGAVAWADVTDSIVVGSGATPLMSGGVATYSLIEGGWPGVGNINVIPRFWSTSDTHLLPQSPAINAGNPTAPLDPDGTRRDIGAIPFDPYYCGPGCDGPQGSSFCPSFPNSSGRIAQLSGLGNDVAANNLLILVGEDLPANAVGYMLGSRTTNFVPFFGGSQGVLCLGGSILRFSNTVFTSTPGGVIAFQPDLMNLPGGNSAISGDSWHFQAWYRDAVGGVLTSNTTTGLEVSFQ